MNQVLNLIRFSFKSLPQRFGYSLISLVGIAMVCLLLFSVSTLIASFQSTFVDVQSYKNYIVIQAGATSELNSYLSAEDLAITDQLLQQIGSQKSLALSAEVYLVVSIPNKSDNTDGNVPLRGLSEQSANLRPGFHLLKGRWPTLGKREVVVGKAAMEMYRGLSVGKTFEIGNQPWVVVGEFNSEHSIANSEIWTGVSVLQNSFGRHNSYQLFYLALEKNDAQELTLQIAANPAVNMRVISEQNYYAAQIQNIVLFIYLLGYITVFIVSLSAIFIAGNCMAASISVRMKEITLYRSIGFNSKSIVITLLLESMFLACLGVMLATLLAFIWLDGLSFSYLNLVGTFTQHQVTLALNTSTIVKGFYLAIFLGFTASLFPALSSVKRNLALAIRTS